MAGQAQRGADPSSQGSCRPRKSTRDLQLISVPAAAGAAVRLSHSRPTLHSQFSIYVHTMSSGPYDAVILRARSSSFLLLCFFSFFGSAKGEIAIESSDL